MSGTVRLNEKWSSPTRIREVQLLSKEQREATMLNCINSGISVSADIAYAITLTYVTAELNPPLTAAIAGYSVVYLAFKLQTDSDCRLIAADTLKRIENTFRDNEHAREYFKEMDRNNYEAESYEKYSRTA